MTDAAGRGTAATGGSARADATPTWALSAAPPAAVGLAILLAAAGLMSAHPQLVLIALPIAASAALAWDRRPRARAPASIAVRLADRGEHTRLHYTIELEAGDGVDAVQLRIGLLGARPRDVVVSRASARHIEGSVPVLHSGPQEMVRVEYRLFATDAAFLSEPSHPLAVTRTVAPPFTAIASLPLPARLAGLTGTHDSARPGSGGEFRDIHPFTPGDRLRRIDWKATARRAQTPGELYVRRSNATADATVLLVLDSRDDVGENIADWSRSTAAGKGLGSMDVARSAASSVAAGYLRSGDRVGFQDLATPSRVIAPGGGTRQLHRLLRAIERTAPSGAPLYRQRPPIIAPGTLVYVFSTFLDDEAGRMAMLWRAGGHRVLAVDTLPAPRLMRLSRQEALAHRIVMMERDDRIRALHSSGVETLPWSPDQAGQATERDARLLALSRPWRAR